MKRVLKILFVVLLVVFIAIQFFPTERNQSDVVPKTDFILVNKVPETIRKNLQASCYDCHSNNTQYPWYNTIQPAAWFLEKHIREGKDELNFNEWDTYSNRRKKSKLKSIINQIKDGEMPLTSYTLVHRDAILSESDKNLIIEWITNLRNNL
jgi:hypothetical protein